MSTPITDAAAFPMLENKQGLWRDVVPADTARRLELDRAALMEALEWLDNWLGHKPMPECSKRITDALSAARANFP